MTHTATITWQRQERESFTDNRYSRAHVWRFDGGLSVPASSNPGVVPPPMSDEHAVDPEEAFVAALSSCHMLWFLAIAAKRGFVVDRYVDEAVGVLGRFEGERFQAMTEVTLHPHVSYSGEKKPTDAEHDVMHHEAHERCFIGNSVKTTVTIEAVVT